MENSKEQIRILHLFTDLNGGGVEQFLLNYYSILHHKNVQFDIVATNSNTGILEPQFIAMGSKVFHVKKIRQNWVQNILQVYRIMRNHHYDIVHCHGYRSVLGLVIAQICGIKARIIHSHIAFEPEGLRNRFRKQLCTILCKLFSTHRYACGKEAGIWLYGKKAYIEHKFEIIHNAIDLRKYSFCLEDRNEIRKALGIQDKTVIGNIARMSYQKNHHFLLEVFKEYLKLNPNSMLVLVGTGELDDEIRKQVQLLNISDHVLFLNCRNDVPELLSGFDIFVLPSHYEGLPVSLVEVQASGLSAIVSDSITKEVEVTNLLEYLPLDKGAGYWAEKIAQKLTTANNNTRQDVAMTGGCYDLAVQAQHLYNCYKSMLKL